MQSQPSRSTTHDCDFAIEAKYVLEVVELDVGFCGGHDHERSYDTRLRTMVGQNKG